MKIIIFVALSLLIITVEATMALPPRGFVNYDVWPRLPCLDTVFGGQEVHIHGFDRDGDRTADAAEIYKPPYSRGQSPTLYAFDIDGNGEFNTGEIFTPAEVLREK